MGCAAGFGSPDVTITFNVIAPEEDDYAVGLILGTPEVQKMEVRANESVITVDSMSKTWEKEPYYWRQQLPGVLRLKKGANKIVFRLPEVTESQLSGAKECDMFKMPKEFSLVSIELGTPSARKAQVERAAAMHSDASWMLEGKYGIFVHWSANGAGLFHNEKRAEWFQESVKLFDVKAFADAVERTGAAWVTFTATHQGFYWPAPSKAVDAVMPERTSERDLLGEIIDELDQRGICTLFYLHTGYNGYEAATWRKAIGADYDVVNSSRFSDNIEAILRECSLRYGEKLHGFGYIDGALNHDYPLDPHWEGWANAIKAGNPDALIGFSSNKGPTVTPFSDLSTRDGGAGLRTPEISQVGPGKQYGDVAPAWWCFMDIWYFKGPMNGKFDLKPRHSKEEYVAYFKQMAIEGVPVTINLAMTSEVTADQPFFNPECMAIMEEVRKAVRGK